MVADQSSIAETASSAPRIYVYVISNIGSFGDEVVKIGMTRRLEPQDRVRELGGASVPFRYGRARFTSPLTQRQQQPLR
jgi:hypothetical protein